MSIDNRDMKGISGIAIDLGTTTIVSIADGKEETRLNSQRKYGRDVISRIGCSLKPHGKIGLRDAVIGDLSEILKDKAKDIPVALAGNNVMISLLMDLNTEGFSHAPFSSEYSESYKGELLGHDFFIFPGIAPFVGGDIVSGIYALNMHRSKEISLLIDLGTNGEMALGNRDRIYVASTSAGPAFEGGALGLKGSEVIDLIYELKETEIIDTYGTFKEDRYIDSGFETGIGSGSEDTVLTVTQDAIRDIQLAKGAIRAGAEVMIKEADITYKDIDRVYLAGNFGSNVRPDRAAGIGLIPREFTDRTEIAWNTSLRGCEKYLRNIWETGKEEEVRSEIENIPGKSIHVELADHGDFNDLFIEYMNL